jgi:cystathionine beta-synthase
MLNMAVYDNVLDMVGDTPLLRLPLRQAGELHLKLEKHNPGSSVKDRAARHMIVQAERAGRIKPGDTIIESSSGNTGISLAMFAAARGYRFVCVVDNHVVPEKIDIMRAYGAVIERVGQDLPPDYHAARERIERVHQIVAQDPSAFYINQGDNLDNGGGHYTTTAMEILNELGDVDYAFLSVGTGGSVTGTGRRLKEHHPETIVVGVEPAGSILFGKPFNPFFQSGAGSSRLVWRNLDHGVVDIALQATDRQAFNTCRFFARHLGLLVGGSGGGLIYKAIEHLSNAGKARVAVALVPDGGERYISSIFNDDWMRDNDLLDPAVGATLSDLIDVEAMRERTAAAVEQRRWIRAANNGADGTVLKGRQQN